MWWYQIIVMIASYILTALLTPKYNRKAEAFDEFDFPQFEEGTPQDVIFGDCWTESWMVLGVGNYAHVAVRKGGGIGGSTVIGYKYYFGIHMGLARGPLDEVLRIKVGDRLAWSGSVTDNTTFAITQPKLFGGIETGGEGGISGTMQVLMGGSTQVPTTELEDMLGGLVPGFRGVTTCFFNGQVCAMNPYPKPWAFRMRRAKKGWYGGAAWYEEKAQISLASATIKAMNPAHIVYECLTNPQWGRGFDAAVKIDDASFRAAADTFYTEGFGLCLKWSRQDSIRNFVQSVLDHTGAAIFPDRTTGMLKLVPIRGDYDPDDLPLFTYDTGLLAVEDDDTGSQSVGVNEVVVKYRHPVDNKDGQVRAHNLGAQYDNGKITKVIEYPGLPTFQLAARVAQRDLQAGSGFLKRFRLRMDRRAYDRAPATLFKFSDPHRGIDNMVVRVGSIEEGGRDGSLTFTVLQDVFGLEGSSYLVGEDNTWVPPEPVDYEVEAGGNATNISVISATQAHPPGSPDFGDMYLIPEGATGDWAGHDGELAVWTPIYVGGTVTGAWVYGNPSPGTLVYVQDTGKHVQANGGGTVQPAPWATLDESVAFAGDITPAALTADVDNYAPTGLALASTLRLSGTGGEWGITGIAGVGDGRVLFLHNVGALCITLKDEDAGSTAANRLALPTDLVLMPDQAVMLQYDSTMSRWKSFGFAPPTTTKGDIIVRGDTNDERLGLGSNGQILGIVDGLPAWVPSNSVFASSINPDSRAEFFDDFMGAVGLTWSDTYGGGGSSSPSGVAGHPGVIRINSGTTSTGYGRLILAPDASTAYPTYVASTDPITVEVLMRAATLPTSGDQFAAAAGLRNTFTVTALVQVAINWDAGTSSARFVLTTRTTAGVATNTVSGVTIPSAGTWHRCKLVITSSGVDLYVDDVFQCTNTTNLPDAGMAPYLQVVKATGTNSRSADFDWFWVRQDFSTGRPA